METPEGNFHLERIQDSRYLRRIIVDRRDSQDDWGLEVSYYFNVWWVNLGHTYAKARMDGYIWAPASVTGGPSFPHWESMKEVEAGDMIICFAQKEIMALSIAKDKARNHVNIKKEGYRIDLDFYDLLRPVGFEEIKPMMDMISASIETNKPFNTLKGMNQGYLFHFSTEGFRLIVERFPDRLPESLKPVLGMAPDTRFSTFLRHRGYFFHQDIIQRFILSLKTKPFVMLSGPSGCGKTALAHLFAQYMDEKKRNDESLTEESDLLSRRWFKISYNDKDIVNAFEGSDKKINLVRKTMLKDGILSLYGLDSKKNIDMNQKKMMKDLKEGDVIIAYQGGYTVGGIGVVLQPHFFDDSGDAFDSFFESTKNFVRIDWLFKGPLKISDFYLDDQRIPAFSMWGDAIHRLTADQIRLFSDYLYTRDIQINEHGVHTRSRTYEIIPVGQNWTDRKPLLGSLDNRGEQYKTTKALELIINAGHVLKRGMDNPFFLILDNMNHSSAEHYLADILCAWETGENVTLHMDDDIAQDTEIPKELSIPSNLFVIGTLAADEQAEKPGLSVLNKANVIELESLRPDEHLTVKERKRSMIRDLNFQESPMANHLKPDDIRKLMRDVRADSTGEGHVMDTLSRHLGVLSGILETAGLELGNRVILDILRYLYLTWDALDHPRVFDTWADALDVQVVQRVLTVIHGPSGVIAKTLECLYGFCFQDIEAGERADLIAGKPVARLLDRRPEEATLTRSAAQLKKMMKTLVLIEGL